MDEMRRGSETYGYITDVAEIDADGWYGDPTWATKIWSSDFTETIGAEVAKRVGEIFALRDETMTVVGGSDLDFVDLPGRRSADPLAKIPTESSVRVVELPDDRAHRPPPPHSEEVVYVEAGDGEVWIDGSPSSGRAGDVVRIPMGAHTPPSRRRDRTCGWCASFPIPACREHRGHRHHRFLSKR